MSQPWKWHVSLLIFYWIKIIQWLHPPVRKAGQYSLVGCLEGGMDGQLVVSMEAQFSHSSPG